MDTSIVSKAIPHLFHWSYVESNTIIVLIEVQKRPEFQMGSFLHNYKTTVTWYHQAGILYLNQFPILFYDHTHYRTLI
jgi:hypothetical protein